MNIKYETSQQTRTENAFIRLTPDEKQELFREAQKAGISISAFVRLLLHNWTKSIIFAPTKANDWLDKEKS